MLLCLLADQSYQSSYVRGEKRFFFRQQQRQRDRRGEDR